MLGLDKRTPWKEIRGANEKGSMVADSGSPTLRRSLILG